MARCLSSGVRRLQLSLRVSDIKCYETGDFTDKRYEAGDFTDKRYEAGDFTDKRYEAGDETAKCWQSCAMQDIFYWQLRPFIAQNSNYKETLKVAAVKKVKFTDKRYEALKLTTPLRFYLLILPFN